MRSVRNNFYVITGGPGSGKTTLIDELRARGYQCVDEAARKIIRQQMNIGGDALDSKDRVLFREVMLSACIDAFERITETARPVFFDRGIPELIGYCELFGYAIPDHLRSAAKLYRYNAKVFVAPPWEEIYRNDAERIQSFAHAITAYRSCFTSYEPCGYSLIELPKVSREARADFVLARIESSG